MHVVHQRSNVTNDYHDNIILRTRFCLAQTLGILPNGQLAFTKYADINTADVNCRDFKRKNDSRVCDSLATIAVLEKMTKDFTLSCKPLA